MRRTLFLAVVSLVVLPVSAEALECSVNGYTVVLINGILTGEETAIQNSKDLQNKLGYSHGNESVIVRTGYNPSHLGGAADLIQSIAQTYDNPISSFDRDTILQQIHVEVNTRKVLLVGHSQGTFYTNAMHRYFLEHGMKEGAIGVYNLATPASFVAGGGSYRTSTNDKVINKIRTFNRQFNTALALPGNINIPLSPDEANNEWGGHYFSSSYLDAAPQTIIGDIANALDRLQPIASTAEDGCFDPPVKTIKQKAEEIVFKWGDPLAVAMREGSATALADAKLAVQNVSTAARVAATALANFWSKVTPMISMANSSQTAAIGSITSTPPAPQNTTPILAPPAPTAPQNTNTPQATATGPSVSVAEQIQVLQERVQALQKQLQETQQSEQKSEQKTPPASESSNPRFTYSSAGGDGSGASAEQEQENEGGQGEQGEENGEEEGNEEEEEQTDEGDGTGNGITVPLSISAPNEGAQFTTTSVTFSGTTTPNLLVTTQYGTSTATTTADSAGDWSFIFELAEGEIEVAIVASDEDGSASEVVSRTVTVDITAPGIPAASISACANSLSAAFCLVPTDSVMILWNDTDEAAYYAVIENDTLGATTTATSSLESIVDNATTTFAIVAYDTAGNAATSTSIEVYSFVQPVIINEIGWVGREAASGLLPEDQWIEFKNISPFVLDMTHTAITRTAGGDTQLSGSLNANADSDLLTILPHDFSILGGGTKLIVPFDVLSTSGEQLALVWESGGATTTIDTTPAVETCSGWCAGAVIAALGTNAEGTSDLHSPLSMERESNAADGSLADSWQDTDSYGPSIGNNTFLWGTPGAENSNGYPDAGVVCGDEILLPADSGAGPSFSVAGECLYLTKFISGGATGRNRSVNIFRGDVGSSTRIKTHSLSKALAAFKTTTMPADSVSGEQFYIAIWESRTGPAFNDTPLFNTHFETGANEAPHTNYKVLPFTYP